MMDDPTNPQGRKRRVPRGRLELVEKLWLEAWDSRRIQVHVSKKWAVSRWTVRADIRRVQAKLALLPKPDPAASRERAEAMLLGAYEVARTGGIRGPQPAAMVTAAARLAQLDGLLKDQIEHTIRDDADLSKLTDDELKTFLALREKTRTEK